MVLQKSVKACAFHRRSVHVTMLTKEAALYKSWKHVTIYFICICVWWKTTRECLEFFWCRWEIGRKNLEQIPVSGIYPWSYFCVVVNKVNSAVNVLGLFPSRGKWHLAIFIRRHISSRSAKDLSRPSMNTNQNNFHLIQHLPFQRMVYAWKL